VEKGVTVYIKLSMMERFDILRIQMGTDAKGTFSSQNFMSEAYRNAEETTSSKRK
jgi:hypothetical protein